ncbi:MAG: putative addiction module antidote protein [Rhodospirillales bacterium]|nr:putative addiction module antidote protein [Rhodospirillales bacterium]
MPRTAALPYDVAEHLRTPEEMAAYLEAGLEDADGDAALIAAVLRDMVRGRDMAQVASECGLSRESLCKALSGDRNPTLDTALRVIGALGLKLRVETVSASDTAGEGSSA